MIKKTSTPPPCFLNNHKLYWGKKKRTITMMFSRGIYKKAEVIL